ncbi:lipid-A-disaccharide synthase [Hydrogenophaga crassostreae]|uniref:Lipid-A-disaccharide synthase n=1 Tax=Hydrogenophaga crassostreae TaxID=1763535 RepID=A0A162P9V3_9BURK|nr:lipid-A-disaccharide synthase [Hydrogenophaga crassostreae]AOW15548.1 lipid-A-disaccharide synthase [Hydrogenophaga crassostreae]OAD42786.1 lipid-A-disaccharide synthase [Hydrogenophaga crassostreae]
MVAGETSGDMLAGLLLEGLRARWPDLQTQGIGGPAMLAQGFQSWWPQEKLAVRGYIEVLPRLWEILSIRRQLRKRLIEQPPALFVGVDAPDFNLGLEAGLRAQGIKTVHFVCPSVWAWRPEKIEKLKVAADHVLCIFPFEPELLAQHGIAASYVGHPLASVIPVEPDRAAARLKLGLNNEDTVVALLPGSRSSEIAYIGQRFFDAAAQLLRRRPGMRFVVPAVPAQRERLQAMAQASGLGDSIQVLAGQSHLAMAACDVTLIASGTATLEAALFKRPMVIAYNMHPMSWRMMKRKQLQPWVGLPNILSGEFVVPELLQDAATPTALAQSVLDWLDSPERIEVLQQRFQALHLTLKRDTAQLATDAIEKILES